VGQYAAIHPEVKNLYPDQPFATEPVSFAVRQGDQKLLNFLNNGIEYLHATGFTEAAVRSYNASYWYEEQTQYAEIK
jgi:ABC-type amino acid transport substrate-binding protein